MSTDIAQLVCRTMTVISEDVKMRIVFNRILPKSFLFPQKDLFEKQAKD